MWEWKALVWGGVISEVGWLSLCGAPPRMICVAPRNLVVWVEENGSGRLFPRGGNSFLKKLESKSGETFITNLNAALSTFLLRQGLA